MNYIVYDESTKEIVRIGTCSEYDFNLQPSSGQGVVEGNFDSSQAYIDNGAIVLYTDEQKAAKLNRPNFFFVWSNETFSWEDPRTQSQKYEEAAETVNTQRIQFLYESDWTQIPNNPLTEQSQQDWATYRQQLRDIPQQSGYPFDVIWPTPPAS